VTTTYACVEVEGMDPRDPARGPGQLVGLGDPVSDGNFVGSDNGRIAPAMVTAPENGTAIICDADCQNYCSALDLRNPVNRALCPNTWGVGLELRPIDKHEACRRLYVDMVGRYPSADEENEWCSGEDWAQIVSQVMARQEFVDIQRRVWADKFLYNNQLVNVERIFDLDELVSKAFRGLVSWDLFATVAASHPVLMRRLASPEDRVDAVYRLFIGRPPYVEERADLARLYRLWRNGYFEHPYLGRVPDAFIDYACVDEQGKPDPERAGPCTSVLWGNHSVVLTRDRRAKRMREEEQLNTMWSGYLYTQEWETLQTPGVILTQLPAFWEHAVDEVLIAYLGYDLGTLVPEVRIELMKELAAANGDIRAVHHAVASSQVYLQSSRGGEPSGWRWLAGPLKQISAEGWIDSILAAAAVDDVGRCDPRISAPREFVREESSGWARALLKATLWRVDDEDQIDARYAELARTLGGCPTNEIGGRFTAVSIVNTAVQESFVVEQCDPGNEHGGRALPIDRLLPTSLAPNAALGAGEARAIFAHQVRLFLGREANEDELLRAESAVGACEPAPCAAESFARPICYSILAGAELMFY
jgi:hypothetical protein